MENESIPILLLKGIFRKNIFAGSLFVIASQLISSVQSYQTISTEMAKLKTDLNESIVNLNNRLTRIDRKLAASDTLNSTCSTVSFK